MSNYNENKIYGFNNAPYSSKNITQHGKKLPVEDDDIKIIDLRPAISRTFSPIGRQIEFPQAQLFSESKAERNCHYRESSSSTNYYHGKHYTLYYQHQPANYNQRQKYLHDRIILIMIGKKWKNVVLFIVEYLHPT